MRLSLKKSDRSLSDMMKKMLLMVLLFLTASNIAAQETVISGILPGAEGREIRLLKTDNWLTEEYVTLDKQIIRPDGSFSFTFYNPQIVPVTLMVSFYRTELFAVPDFHHVFHGEKFVFDDRINPFIGKPQLPLRFSKNDTLNRYVIEFEKKMDEFEYKNILQLRERKNVSLLDSLYKIPKNLSDPLRLFYEKYVNYSIGTHKINYFLNKPLSLGKVFLNVENFDPDDFCYMRFFNAFFDNYFPNQRSGISLRDIQGMITTKQPINVLLDYLGKDQLLVDEEIRDLVCLKLLMDHFGSISSTVDMMQKLAAHTRFEKIKVLVPKVISVIKRFKEGTPAPDFVLTQSDGNMFNSKDLKGKYVYIMFFKTNCTECLSEMEQMRMVYEKNKDFFEFVSISLDDKKSDFISFANNYKFPWKLLYAGTNYDFVEQWQTKSFPLQALISKSYTFMEYPSVNVYGGIIPKIEKISWEENRSRRQQGGSSKASN